MARKDYTGERFGMLTVIARIGRPGKGLRKWIFRCRCGNYVVRAIGSVKAHCSRNKSVASCGCIRFHGLSRHPLYRRWSVMKSRCCDPGNNRYMHYGGRGVSVCERWQNSAVAFIEDMGPTFKEGLTLDRIDNNKGYSPENCRWTTYVEQNRNRSINAYIEVPEYGRVLLVEAAERSGIPPYLIKNRIKQGWPSERLLEQAAIGRGKDFIEYGYATIVSASERSGIPKSTIAGRIKRGWPRERWLDPVKNKRRRQ